MKIKFISIIIPMLTFFLTVSGQSQSVLASGQWWKIGVTENGIYRIDKDLIEKMGLNPNEVNPNHIRLFGNGGAMLPQNTSDFRFDDLYENELKLVGNATSFNESTYLLFYGQSAHSFNYNVESEDYSYERNIYSDTTYYFLKLDAQGQRKIQSANTTATSAAIVNSFQNLAYHEKDEFNLLISGREWFGESFEIQNNQSFEFPIKLTANGTSELTLRAMATNAGSLEVRINGNSIGSLTFPSLPSGTYSTKGTILSEQFTFTNSQLGNRNQIKVDLIWTGGGRAYLDRILINANSPLELVDDAIVFDNTAVLNQVPSRMQISGFSSTDRIWEISNPFRPKEVNYEWSSNSASFTISNGFLRTFIAFSPAAAKSVQSVKKVFNQNIRSAAVPDLLIVAHPSLLTQALRLANYRTQYSGYEVLVASTEQLYNEFASGQQDLTAIRDAARYFYLQDSSKFKYLLLFGTASYEYKNKRFEKGNLVPSYQSVESMNPVSTYSSDDYFGFLRDGVGEWSEDNFTDGAHLLDIGVGRLPAKNVQEAKAIVDKIIRYENSAASKGAWRKKITYVADDERNSNVHVNYSEELATITANDFNNYNIDKIYIDAFEQEARANGKVAPAANESLMQNINNGTLLINYIGHGNESVWADEQIFTKEVIQHLDNADRLPIFVTATCEFGRHDNPGFTSGAEQLLIEAHKGAIATLTTSRPVWNTTNQVLNRAFIRHVFALDNNRHLTLGEIMKRTKNASIQGVSNRNFILLGDPSMRIGVPEKNIVVDELRDGFTQLGIDTLGSLQEVLLSGSIRKLNGEIDYAFNGEVQVQVFEKENEKQTLGFQSDPMIFTIYDDVIHRGRASVHNGQFELRFRVSENIRYDFGKGRMSFYAINNDRLEDAAGTYDDFIIGGSGPAINVSHNPEIQLFINDTTFVSGRKVNHNPLLIAYFQDELGISISNQSIDRQLQAKLISEKGEQHFILNDYYVSDLDSYQTGRLEFPLGELEKGSYSLEVSAWNNANVGHTELVHFEVTDTTELLINDLIFYPNPAKEMTNIRFLHNRGGENLAINMRVFNMSGNLVFSKDYEMQQTNAMINPISWDLRDNNHRKLDTGLYLLQFTIRSTKDGAKNVASQKLIVVN